MEQKPESPEAAMLRWLEERDALEDAAWAATRELLQRLDQRTRTAGSDSSASAAPRDGTRKPL